jgi:hypothetical protein
LEREILALRKQKFNGVVITHPKVFKPTIGKMVAKYSGVLPKNPELKGKEPGKGEILKAGSPGAKEKTKPKKKIAEKGEVPGQAKDVFTNIPEAQYAPPNVRDFGAAQGT